MLAKKLIAISGASGAGKTTLLKIIQNVYGADIVTLASVTTRAPREHDESAFRYVTQEEFAEMEAQNEFIWTKEVHGNKYGTRHTDLAETFASGKCAISIVTPDRQEQIYEAALACGLNEDEILLIHICSPGEEVLRARLLSRGDSPDAIQGRINDSREWDELVKTLSVPITILKNDHELTTLEPQMRTLIETA